MSEQKFPEDSIRPEEMSLDELIRSTKEEISQGAPTTFEPTLPTDYAELVSEEEELSYDENEYDDRYRMPGVIKGLLYVCCVLAAVLMVYNSCVREGHVSEKASLWVTRASLLLYIYGIGNIIYEVLWDYI